MSEQATFVRQVPPVSGESTASTHVSEEGVPLTISGFQNNVYYSMLGSICIIGLIAVLMVQRGLTRTKALKPIYVWLGILFAVIALHAFVSSWLYAGYLNGEATEASLLYRFGGWMIFAGALGWLRTSLFGIQRIGGESAKDVDAVLFGAVFLAAALSVWSGMEITFGVVLGVVSLCLYGVIVARSLALHKTAIAENPALQSGPYALVLSALVYGPAVLLLVVILNFVGIGHDALHLLLTIAEVALVVFVGGAFFALSLRDEAEKASVATNDAEPSGLGHSAEAANESSPEEVADPFGSVAPEPDKANQAPKTAAKPSAPKPVIVSRSGGKAPQIIKRKDASPAPAEPATPKEPERSTPAKPKVQPPSKPGTSRSIKAPQKPKRRF